MRNSGNTLAQVFAEAQVVHRRMRIERPSPGQERRHPVGPVVSPADTPVVQSLALRNLLRGSRLGLPSYQDVATAMGIAPLGNDQLGLSDPAWGGTAPLWYGILKESEILNNGARLGPTGGRIVAEVILQLIDTDDDSYFNARRPWVPGDGSTPGTFFMHDLLRLAGAL